VLERYGTRLRVALSPDLEVNSFTQYDNASRQLGTDVRIRWTFRPTAILRHVQSQYRRAAWQPALDVRFQQAIDEDSIRAAVLTVRATAAFLMSSSTAVARATRQARA